MPLIRLEDAPLDEGKAEGLNAELGPYTARLLSDAGGLTQFGAFVETLPPGSRSSHRHWHEREDEMVYILSGTVTLIEGEAETEMQPGDAATFKAGVEIGHCLENRSDADVTYLVIGTRAADDVVHYPDRDMKLIKVNYQKRLIDAEGFPVKPD